MHAVFSDLGEFCPLCLGPTRVNSDFDPVQQQPIESSDFMNFKFSLIIGRWYKPKWGNLVLLKGLLERKYIKMRMTKQSAW